MLSTDSLMALLGVPMLDHKIHSCLWRDCSDRIGRKHAGSGLGKSYFLSEVNSSSLLPEYSIGHKSFDEYDQRGKKEDGEKTALMSEVQKVELSTGEWPSAR